jgi:RNA polymerase sigma-70 factor, ECF subfamily
VFGLVLASVRYSVSSKCAAIQREDVGGKFRALTGIRPVLFTRTAAGDRTKAEPQQQYDRHLMPGADVSGTASLVLLERIRAGDTAALNQLMQRYLPRLSRWASGRLPRWARDLSETGDLVQDTLIRAADNLKRFEPRGEGALYAYLRSAVMNRIRDEIRRTSRSKAKTSLDTSRIAEVVDHGQSPLEEAIGRQLLEKYDAALDRLDSETREAVIARIEMGSSYAEIAEALGKSSPDAARMTVSRALVRLAREMRHGR